MKKCFAILLILLLALSLWGCGAAPLPLEEEGGAPLSAAKWEPADSALLDERESFRAYIRADLPEGWAWELLPVEESYPPPALGLMFYPRAEPEARVFLSWYPEPFGMCGTGVSFSQLSLREDLQATLAYEPRQSQAAGSGEEQGEGGLYTVIFSDVPGSYVALFSLTAAQKAAYYDTILEILATAQLGPGDAMREREAAALALAAAGLQDGGSAYGRYQWRDNSWLVTLPEDAGGKTYLVSALGDVIECR